MFNFFKKKKPSIAHTDSSKVKMTTTYPDELLLSKKNIKTEFKEKFEDKFNIVEIGTGVTSNGIWKEIYEFFEKEC